MSHYLLHPRNFGESVCRWRPDPRRRPTAGDRIEAHLPLVRALALRFARRGEPLDDLVQAGCIGLIHAVDRHDPALGAFEAYAVPTITGEIQRHLRDRGSVLRVPPRVIAEAGGRGSTRSATTTVRPPTRSPRSTSGSRSRPRSARCRCTSAGS